MKNVISKRQTAEIGSSSKKVTDLERPLRTITLEEALNSPFIMKKHNNAVATLTKYPVPKELLERLGNGSAYVAPVHGT